MPTRPRFVEGAEKRDYCPICARRFDIPVVAEWPHTRMNPTKSKGPKKFFFCTWSCREEWDRRRRAIRRPKPRTLSKDCTMTEELLRKYYEQEGRSSTWCAREFHCSPNSVLVYCRKHGIEVRRGTRGRKKVKPYTGSCRESSIHIYQEDKNV